MSPRSDEAGYLSAHLNASCVAFLELPRVSLPVPQRVNSASPAVNSWACVVSDVNGLHEIFFFHGMVYGNVVATFNDVIGRGMPLVPPTQIPDCTNISIWKVLALEVLAQMKL